MVPPTRTGAKETTMPQAPAKPSRNVVEATGTDVGSMEALRNQRNFEADTKKGQGDRLRTAVNIHPALADQAKKEAEAKAPAVEKPAEKKPEDKPAEKPRDDKGQFIKSQEENFAALRDEVRKAKDEAAILRKEMEALRPAAKPPVDPINEAMGKVLEKIPVEQKGYWEQYVLPAIRDVVLPVHEEARGLKAELERRDATERKTSALTMEARKWAVENGMDAAQLQSVIGKVFDEGLEPVLDTNPRAALNAAKGLLGLGKVEKPAADPEAEKKAAEAEEAENRARAKAGGVDASSAGPSPSGDNAVDFARLIREAEARGDRQEARRLHNMRFRAAANIDPEWLKGNKNILGPE